MTTTVEAGKVLDSAKPDPNRPTTQADAIKLGQVYARLANAKKALTTAKGELEKGLAAFDGNGSVEGLMESFQTAADSYATTLVDCRSIINELPNGVTGPGGKANRQTIVLEFYGPVNRNLNVRLSAADAKSLNKAAWGR